VNVGGVPVQINSSGQLGAQTSSLRFKEQVADMGDTSRRLFQVRPVTFFYKPQTDDGSRSLQYGRIAEEVAKVYPDMVAYDKDGQPFTVKYQYLAPMLLNELQKQHSVVIAQQDVIKTQQERANVEQQQLGSLQKQNEEFQQRQSRLEALIGRQVARN
jgi:trimeric autotransporter adhesin